MIVQEQETATAIGYTNDANGNKVDIVGTVTDDLGGSPDATGQANDQKYTVVSGGSFTVNVSLTAKVSASPGPNYPQGGYSVPGYCSVTVGIGSITISTYPVALSLQGTTKGTGGSDNILIGQTCPTSLDVINRPSGLTMDTPQWTIAGDVFTSFNISSDQSTGVAIPYPDPSRAGSPLIQPWFYWKSTGAISGATPETVSAKAFVRDASGSSIGTITGTKTINVWVPDEYDTPLGTNGNYAVNPKLGTVGIDTSHAEVVSNDPSGNSGGYDLQASVVTPDLFTSGGTVFGDWAWLQLCQLDVTQGGAGTQMAAPELDSSFPYNTGGSAANGVPGVSYDAKKSSKGNPVYNLFSDSPSEGWNDYFLHYDTVFAFNNNFGLYVMYQPPDAGYGVNWVPVSLYKWSFSASMTRSGLNGTWTPNPPGTVANYGRTDYPNYPSWTSKFAP